MGRWLGGKYRLIFLLAIFAWWGLVLPLFFSSAFADDVWVSLKTRLVQEGFATAYIEKLFSHPHLSLDSRPLAAKTRELYNTRIPPKERALLLGQLRRSYRAYERESTVQTACAYLKKHGGLLQEVEKKYGVPKEVITAIVLVESRMERNIGAYSAFISLASLANYSKLSDVEPHLALGISEEDKQFIDAALRKRANWAYAELKALILYSLDNSLDPLAIRGSIYGAIGICQFMPSNIYLYGVDGNNDGVIDLWERADAFASIANYLVKNGWRNDMSRKEKLRVIFRYNNSTPYAEGVLLISERLRGCNR